MTNLTIGRVGLDVELGSNVEFEQDGDVLSLSGTTPYSSAAEGAVIAGQLLGYGPDADEQVIPCTFAEAPDINGFYRVIDDPRVERPSGTTFAGVLPFRMRLKRVRSAASPLQQLTHVGAPRVADGSWNLIPNPGGEAGTAGTEGVSGGGAVTMSNPTATAYEGAKVLRSTWMQSSTAAGAGQRTTPFPVVPGMLLQFGVNRVRSTVSNRLRGKITFYSDMAATTVISEISTPEKQVAANTVYGDPDFRALDVLVPWGAVTARARVENVAGTGFANFPVNAYLETDGWVCNYGVSLLSMPVWQNFNARMGLSIPLKSHSLVVQDSASQTLNSPFVSPKAGVVKRAAVLSGSGRYSVRYYCPPEYHYQGAATLRALSGGALHPVVGRQMGNTPGDWVIGNDVFEIRPNFTGEAAFEYRCWLATTWSPWSTFTLRSENQATGALAALGKPKAIAILKNTPELVIVRLMTTYIDPSLLGTSEVPVTVDLTLRRGDSHVSVTVTAATPQWLHLLMPTFEVSGVSSPYGYYEDIAGGRFVSSATPLRVGANISELGSPYGVSWTFAIGMLTTSSIVESLWGGAEVPNTVLL